MVAPPHATAFPSLLSFRGRLARRPYLVLQLISATLLVTGIAFAFTIFGAHPATVPGGTGEGFYRGWSLGATLGCLVGSMWVGATAVTRRARDAALPAAFVGLLYITNRLNLPITAGVVGSADVRAMALVLATMLIVMQILLVARDSRPRPAPHAAGGGRRPVA